MVSKAQRKEFVKANPILWGAIIDLTHSIKERERAVQSEPVTVPEPEPEHPESERIREIERELGPLTARVKVLQSEMRRLKNKVYQREYREKHKDTRKEWRIRYGKEYQRQWRKRNPGYTTQVARRKRRAKREENIRERERSLSECMVCHGVGKVKCLVCGSAD